MPASDTGDIDLRLSKSVESGVGFQAADSEATA